MKGVNSHVGLLVVGYGTHTDIRSPNVIEENLFQQYICFTQTNVIFTFLFLPLPPFPPFFCRE